MSAGTLTLLESVGAERISGVAGAIGSACCNVFTESIDAAISFRCVYRVWVLCRGMSSHGHSS